MISEFERNFYKASIVQSSLNILSRLGNHEAVFCEVLNLIKAERRKGRFDPHKVSLVDQEALFVRNAQLNRVLGREDNFFLTGKEYRTAMRLLEKNMKKNGITFRRF